MLSPLFIVSSGRSGTTLLRAMLNAGDDYYIPYESEFIARAYPCYADKVEFNNEDYTRIARQFKITSDSSGWGMTQDYIVDQLIKHKPQSFAEVHDVICKAYLHQIGADHAQWGIKTPYLVDSLDVIFAVYPDAKVVHIVRNGKDVYLSYQDIHNKNKTRFGPKGLAANAYYWVQGLRRIEKAKCSSIYELRYEDLLNDSANQLKALCVFLGVKYSESMNEDYHRSKWAKLLTVDREQIQHKKTKQGLDRTNAEKYMTRMTRFQRFAYELMAGWYLQKYNYKVEYPFLSSRLMYCLNLPVYLLAKLYRDRHNAKKFSKHFK